ncbi:hypothetical protein EP331_02415 [bacterium]|nr:MAG: hypothetical protein EP331_02415 [bacterium]
MIGLLGKFAVGGAFLASVFSLIYYGLISFDSTKKRAESLANTLFIAKTVLITIASGLLIYLIATHQFQYFYVYNYTSLDLNFKYLISAFYGGQEGSFLLWTLFSGLIGIGLIRWTSETYRAPVMFIITMTQFFILSMILGLKLGDFTIGASPFRTLVEALPDAPFLQANPDFVPVDGKGLNDLLKSPWMMIHPPILFIGFSMMTVPYAFAMAALWKEKYQEWIKPALPWVLGANLALLTAIFLGAYWAYVTLSFGGYWAWDPVENASFVPWLFGVAGIHTMLIQRKHASASRSSIAFALLSYVAIVYETFLTRSGILGDASVHSFVDLGLYAQLVVFMIVMTGLGLVLYIYRSKQMPQSDSPSHWLNKDTWVFWGSMALFIGGLIIITGTSSPILGKLFQKNPTPPQISFYNDWTLPVAIIIAIMSVCAQFLWWKKLDATSFANAISMPLIITSFVTLLGVVLGDVRQISYILLLYSGVFAIVGNATILFGIAKKKTIMVGGTLTHVGFGLLIVGILYSSAYNSFLLDDQTKAYNAAVRRGEVKDEMGTPIIKEVTMIELKKDIPKVVNNEYLVSFKGYRKSDVNRPGEQLYSIQVSDLDGNPITRLEPTVFPMLQSSTATQINWSVDPDVFSGLLYDVYLYVAGSSVVESENAKAAKLATAQGEHAHGPDSHHLPFTIGQAYIIGKYEIKFIGFKPISPETDAEYPKNATVAVRIQMEFRNVDTNEKTVLNPLFAIVDVNGNKNMFTPIFGIDGFPASIQMVNLVPMSDQIEVHITGIEGEASEDEWVLLIAEKKPFVSIVWLGTFIIMAGFSVSIIRRWKEDKNRMEFTA